MRRLFVVLSVFAALAFPVRPDPASAATAAACDMWGVQSYGPPLPPAVNPPTTYAVIINVTLTCISVSPVFFSLSASGSMFGSCAAETGTAAITTAGVFGTMTWARVGLHDYFVIDFSTPGSRYLYTAPTAWTPPSPLTDCISPGVANAGLRGFGPLVGV